MSVSVYMIDFIYDLSKMEIFHSKKASVAG